MKNRTTESSQNSLGTHAARARRMTGTFEAVTSFMRLLKRVTGAVLGSLAVSAQVTNTLICLSMLFVGPTFILEVLAP